MIKSTQIIQLILMSFLFSCAMASLIELYDPELGLTSLIISFVIWFLAGIRYFKLKNEMMKYKPPKASIH